MTVCGLSSTGVAQAESQIVRLRPRGNPSFYRDLLAVFDAMESAGVTDPVKTLCRITGRPEGTVKTQLRVARRGGLSHPSEVGRAMKEGD